MTGSDYTHVTLVVDPRFGQKAKAQSELGPLWIIESPENTPVIEEIWANGKSLFADSPTYFEAAPGQSPEEAAALNIGAINEHHPNWQTLEVIGVELSDKLLGALTEYAVGTVNETKTGFVFRREPTSN